jgi:hypothetical protein
MCHVRRVANGTHIRTVAGRDALPGHIDHTHTHTNHTDTTSVACLHPARHHHPYVDQHAAPYPRIRVIVDSLYDGAQVQTVQVHCGWTHCTRLQYHVLSTPVFTCGARSVVCATTQIHVLLLCCCWLCFISLCTQNWYHLRQVKRANKKKNNCQMYNDHATV